jgi:DMSO reductase anchor subunit
MNPAFSVIVFTTVAGAAQGLVVALALAMLGGVAVGPAFAARALLLAAALLVVGLGASFLHLGRPERAWRAAAMWRSSWLSREVIVLPGFIALVLVWWLAFRLGAAAAWTHLALPLAAIAAAALLWLCTAMIYACLRFIEEWAHPLTFVNFVLTGLASGSILAVAAGSLAGEAAFVAALAPLAVAATLVACGARLLALRRNAGLRHRSSVQSATGIAAPRLVQTSMGMSAGSFNTREFFHGASRATLRTVRIAAVVLGFVVPALLAALALVSGQGVWWLCAVPVQVAGLLADRWTFFAEAKHPQNLYYQLAG